MKKIIEDICVWVLGQLNIQRLRNLTIDENRIVVGISKFVPDDDRYHEIAATVIANIKIKPGSRKKEFLMNDVSVYLDGNLVRKYKLEG